MFIKISKNDSYKHLYTQLYSCEICNIVHAVITGSIRVRPQIILQNGSPVLTPTEP